MPLIMELMYLLFSGRLFLYIVREYRAMKFGDPQLVAVKQFGPGYSMLQAGRHLQALQYFTEQLHGGCKHPEVAYWLRACTFYVMGKGERALRDCDDALKHSIYLSGAYGLRGQIYYGWGQWRAALENFDYALHLNDAKPQWHSLRAACLRHLGHLQQAVQADVLAEAQLARNT